MSTRSPSDIPNRAVNLFLQEAGERYDRQRGLDPYRRMTPEILEFFDNACAYCRSTGELIEEHVVPRNRVHAGLHSWGNVVPACRPCNRAKSGRLTWHEHLANVVDDDGERRRREERLRQFQTRYRYSPDTATLAARAQTLYREVDEVARRLVADAVADSADAISALTQPEIC